MKKSINLKTLFGLATMVLFLGFNANAQDNCASAKPIACGVQETGTISGFLPAFAPFCGVSNTSPGHWYSFAGTGEDHTATTLYNNYGDMGSKVSVYSGSCGVLTCVGGDGSPGGFYNAYGEVDFTSVVGTDYYILVHGYNNNGGHYRLNLSCATPPVFPENDECFNAIPIACGGSAIANTTLATFDDAPYCSTRHYYAGVWYSFTGTGDLLRFQTKFNAGTSIDTKISAYTVPGASCAAGLTCVKGDDTYYSPYFLEFSSVLGQEYLILVSQRSGSLPGQFELSLTCISPPDNDDVCDATFITVGETAFSNVAATVEPGEAAPPKGTNGSSSTTSTNGWSNGDYDFWGLDNTVWFYFAVPPSGCFSVTATGPNANTWNSQIAVYSVGTCGDFSTYDLVAANDDSGADFVSGAYNRSAGVQLPCYTPGDTFYVQVDGYRGDTELNATIHLIDCGGDAVLSLASSGGCQSAYDGYAPLENDTNFLEACAVGGMPPYTFSKWERVGEPGVYPAGLFERSYATCTNLAVAPDVTTFYTVTATDALGCTASTTIEVFVIDLDCSNNPNSTKIQLCHNGRTLCVSADAVQAHLDHGDLIGECGNPCVSVNEPFPPIPPDAEICTETENLWFSNFTVEDRLIVPANGNLRVSDLNVSFLIELQYIRMLVVKLTSPSGTEIELFNGNSQCGSWSYNNSVDLNLNDSASTVVCGDDMVGEYAPYEALAGFNGEVYEGVWTLSVLSDYRYSYPGNLATWCMDPVLVDPPADCAGVVGGNNYPGDHCDDGDPTTMQSRWSETCVCEGGIPVCDANNPTFVDLTISAVYGWFGISCPSALWDVTDGVLIDSLSGYTSGTEIDFTYCVDPDHCYEYTAYATGLAIPSDYTSYVIYMNGDEVTRREDNHIADGVAEQFGNCSGAGPTAPSIANVAVEGDASIMVFPNPTNGVANMQFNVTQTGNVDIALYSMDGRKVAQIFSGNVEAGAVNVVDFNAANLPSGVYIYQLVSNDDLLSGRLQITK